MAESYKIKELKRLGAFALILSTFLIAFFYSTDSFSQSTSSEAAKKLDSGKKLYVVMVGTESSKQSLQDQVRSLRAKMGASFKEKYLVLYICPSITRPTFGLVVGEAQPFGQAMRLLKQVKKDGFRQDPFLWGAARYHGTSARGQVFAWLISFVQCPAEIDFSKGNIFPLSHY